MRTIAEIGILVVFIAEVVIDDQRRTIEGLPLHVLLKREATIAQDVVVCVVAHVVLGCLYRTDAARSEGIGRGYLERQAGEDIGIGEADTLCV